jgi:CRP-like cAMP-binding protein
MTQAKAATCSSTSLCAVWIAKQSGRKVERGVDIDFPISRQDIAQMTGTTLHTVSRILSGWEQAGLIESSRQPERIFALAEQAPDDGA